MNLFSCVGRQWMRRCISQAEVWPLAEAPGSIDLQEFTPKFGKRRKYAVLLSYRGRGYMGMQKNPGLPTIEDDLLAAMQKALAFPECMQNDLRKLHFERCSRTDKGVSAARQLISLKMVDLEDPAALINTYLPPHIRVMSVKRVTQGFNSHQACVARTYEYLMPTYALAPDLQTTTDYRLPDSTLCLVSKLLARYEGTHNFHNFTSGRKFHDPSSSRHILSFKCSDQFTGKKGDDSNKEIEFITLRVKGQSFMTHQIRKMIGFMIAIVRGALEEKEFDKVFQAEKMDIPRAPALGLLLENVCFDHYNAKFCGRGERPKLEWSEVEEEINRFKRDYIYRTIIETEIEEMSMMSWLQKLCFHDFHQSVRCLNAESEQELGAGVDIDCGMPKVSIQRSPPS